MLLYDNALSPFARKVRIALTLKGLHVDVVDGLDVRERDGLEAVNGRVEVPALVVGPRTIVGSADILAYLDRRQPDPMLYPADADAYAQVRAWERCADTYIDAIVTPVSVWSWADRDDTMPDGMLETARRDLEEVYDALDRHLARSGPFIWGDAPSAAECALFPHLTGVKSLSIGFDMERCPHLARWFKMLRQHPAFAEDIVRARGFLRRTIKQRAVHLERTRLFWRGDRLEWLLARGFHDWLGGEIAAKRVLWPGPDIPR